MAYARQVADGRLDPDREVSLEAHQVRAGGLGEGRVGQRYALSELARRVMRNDPSAEELLVATLGGAEAVNVTRVLLDLDLGDYLTPCEVDRAFAVRIDERFADLDCPTVSRWVSSRDDADAGFEVGPIDEERRIAAWNAVTIGGAATGTARAWGRLLTEAVAGTLLSGETSRRLREVLDESEGDGGGGDRIPGRAWVQSLDGVLHRGRHWIGAIHDEHPRVVVMLTDHHSQAGVDAQTRFGWVALEAHVALGGAGEPWPPEETERPDWFVDAMLVDGRIDVCRAPGFDDLLSCHRQARVSGYGVGSEAAVSVFLRDGPLARVAWHFTDPAGARKRYQVRLGAGGWWLWTRTYPLELTGDWNAAVYANGEPYLSLSFPVR